MSTVGRHFRRRGGLERPSDQPFVDPGVGENRRNGSSGDFLKARGGAAISSGYNGGDLFREQA
jgi:hypothetical protein